MKKIIGIAIASLVFCNVGFAEIRLIEEKFVERDFFKIWISTFCVDGYKFVVFEQLNYPNNHFQALEERDGKSLPAKC